MAIKEEHFAHFGGLVNIDGLKGADGLDDMLADRDGHGDFIAADWIGEVGDGRIHSAISPYLALHVPVLGGD